MSDFQFLKPKKNPRAVVMDDRLIRREIYNPGKYRITFIRMFTDPTMPLTIPEYCKASGISWGPAEVVCEPHGFCILNHAFYVVRLHGAPDGELFDVIQKYGNDIGNGSTLPSRPEVKKNFY